MVPNRATHHACVLSKPNSPPRFRFETVHIITKLLSLGIFDLQYVNRNMFTVSNKNTRTLCEINIVSERHKLYMLKKYLT